MPARAGRLNEAQNECPGAGRHAAEIECARGDCQVTLSCEYERGHLEVDIAASVVVGDDAEGGLTNATASAAPIDATSDDDASASVGVFGVGDLERLCEARSVRYSFGTPTGGLQHWIIWLEATRAVASDTAATATQFVIRRMAVIDDMTSMLKMTARKFERSFPNAIVDAIQGLLQGRVYLETTFLDEDLRVRHSAQTSALASVHLQTSAQCRHVVSVQRLVTASSAASPSDASAASA